MAKQLLIISVVLFLFAENLYAAADWVSDSGVRYRELATPAQSDLARPHLTEIPISESGISFRSEVPEDKGAENSIRLAGTGVAAGDVDGDGWCDLFFASMGGQSALYRNLGGWRFQDITAEAGLALEGQDSTGAVFADVDGDGDLDLLVNSIGGGTRLFLNDGQGHFREATECGLIRKYGSNSLALADIDGNGTLDLYVVNYAKTKIEDRPATKIQTRMVNGKPMVAALDNVPITSPELTNRYYIDGDHVLRELGEADILYLNDGHGHFTPVSWTDGSFLDEKGQALPLPPYDWGLSVAFHDLNGDHIPDIYVCNDLFSPDRIWLNDGHGHFRAASNFAIRQTSLFSMGIDFADINGDGWEDFLVADMLSRGLTEEKVQIIGVKNSPWPPGRIDNRPQYKRNTLFLNRGDSTYAEIGQLSGIDATGWSWSPVFLDLDLDGYPDLLVTTGYYRDALNADAIARMKSLRGNRKLSDAEYHQLKKLFPPLPQRNQTYRNRGDLTFENKTDSWGFDFNGISQAICLADLDNDGDLDVILVRQNGPVAIYRNDCPAPRVAVRLKGKGPNTRGIGATIKLLGSPVAQSFEMTCGGRYLSGDENERVFATGAVTNGLVIEVLWPNGLRSVVGQARPNCIYEIDEEGARPASADKPQSRRLFEDVSNLINHPHIETEFDDFASQPTLAHKLSQLGPGVAWLDRDGDGFDDLIVGTGRGGSAAVFRNSGKGSFARVADPDLDRVAARDWTSILGLPLKSGQTVLISGMAAYEDGITNSAIARVVDPSHNLPAQALFGDCGSVGPMALADVDGDGELDLFVGGRVVPGHYPEPASSLLYRGRQVNGGQFVLDQENSATFSRIGLVSGAVFSDLDGDGFPELILACEWGPVRVYRNEHGKFVEATEPLGFSKYVGWWNGVTVGDFDGDGKMDIVASNWGRNTKYEHYRSNRLRLYFGTSRPSGLTVPVLACYDEGLKKWLPRCGFATFAKALPSLNERIHGYQAYGTAGIEELFGSEMSDVRFLEANWLDSTVFLNRGDHFEARPLPIEAQFAPAFGVSVADFDGDGFEDIFLSQNFFAVDNETARYDAGRGLLLKGDGKGEFTSVPGQISGIEIYGEQRGCAVADYDGDGRPDLVVTQNAGETKLYHNVEAKPGLRIQVRDAKGKPAIGALMRLGATGLFGPARELHAGSGYWSQDSATQVMSLPASADQIWIRWPGGKTNLFDIPSDAKEILLQTGGLPKKIR